MSAPAPTPPRGITTDDLLSALVRAPSLWPRVSAPAALDAALSPRQDSSDVFEAAAAVLVGVARSKALDGMEQRGAWVAACLVLHVNRRPVPERVDQDEAEQLVVGAAEGRISEREAAVLLRGLWSRRNA